MAENKYQKYRKYYLNYNREYRKKYPNKIKSYDKKYRDANQLKIRLKCEIYRSSERGKVCSILKTMRWRCNNHKSSSYKYYGGRGIKCLISLNELQRIWIRDKANKMKKPSIDRINNDDNYTYSNCQFLELSKNISKSNLNKPRHLCHLLLTSKKT